MPIGILIEQHIENMRVSYFEKSDGFTSRLLNFRVSIKFTRNKIWLYRPFRFRFRGKIWAIDPLIARQKRTNSYTSRNSISRILLCGYKMPLRYTRTISDLTHSICHEGVKCLASTTQISRYSNTVQNIDSSKQGIRNSLRRNRSEETERVVAHRSNLGTVNFLLGAILHLANTNLQCT